MSTTTNYEKHQNNNPLSKVLLKNFYKELLIMAKKIPNESILDVGCGEGFTLSELKKNGIGKRLEGIEYIQEALDIGKKLFPDFTFKKGDIYRLPYKDNTFDIVVCTEVLEHLDKPKDALKELQRVSKKHLILSVPNEPYFTFQRIIRGKNLFHLGAHPEHIQWWTHSAFLTFLVKNGLKVMDKKAPFAWTLVLAAKK